MIRALKYDPIPVFLKSEDEALRLFVSHDLLGKNISTEDLWQLSDAQKIIKKQRIDGSWKYSTVIKKALEYFIGNQQENGLWNLNIVSGRNKDNLQLWLALSVCRIFKRFFR